MVTTLLLLLRSGSIIYYFHPWFLNYALSLRTFVIAIFTVTSHLIVSTGLWLSKNDEIDFISHPLTLAEVREKEK